MTLRKMLVRGAGALLALLVALALLVLFFPWDWLREPLNRYVSDKTGRSFEIRERLEVKLGRVTRIRGDGVRFANPAWAREADLVQAKAAEVHLRLWPLLRGQVELPRIELVEPALALEMDAQGRRTWALDRQGAPARAVPRFGELVVDHGTAKVRLARQQADLRVDFKLDDQGGARPANAQAQAAPDLPLSFAAKGLWRGQPFVASGRTGGALQLAERTGAPFPIVLRATSGPTRLRADGQMARLTTLDGASFAFDLQGANLAQLYGLFGVVLPETPPYTVRGRITRQGALWSLPQLEGTLGKTDVRGAFGFDQSGAVPMLSGWFRSRSLDFKDLAPLVGLSATATQARPLPGQPAAAAPARGRPANAGRVAGRVLPNVPLDIRRLRAMNADVRYTAERIVNAPSLPLERGSVHVKLAESVLALQPLDLGVAGGTLRGSVRIDGREQPARTRADLEARSLELSELFPGLRITRSSYGKLHGDIELEGRGATAAQMLGTSSGDVSLLMGKGQISNLLLEIAGLDGAEIVKFLLGRDRNVGIHCAALDFRVDGGLMRSRTVLLDTEDTIIRGTGTINLANEQMDLTLRPEPKDVSILSLRSPLKVSGSLGAPRGGLDRSALAGRAGLAVALGVVNPLLALAATIETGPGQDADCAGTLRASAQSRKTESAVLGAGPADPAGRVARGAQAGGPQPPRVQKQ